MPAMVGRVTSRPNLQLEGAQHRVVEKGAALDHNVLAQIIGAGGPNDLVDGVFYHGDGQPRGDVLHRGARPSGPA